MTVGKGGYVHQESGRKILVEWVAKEVKTKRKLDYDYETFYLADDHQILRFRSEGDCAAILRGGP